MSNIVEVLNAFQNNEKSEEKIKSYLLSNQSEVWDSGVAENEVEKIIEVFVLSVSLDVKTREGLLKCLVPRSKLTKKQVDMLMLWFFPRRFSNTDEAKLILEWFTVMVPYNLVDVEALENYFYPLLSSFVVVDLIRPICSLLETLVNPKLVNRRSLFLAKQCLDTPCNIKEQKHVANLIRFFESIKRLADVSVSRGPSSLEKTTKFSKAVAKYASARGFSIIPHQSHHKMKMKSSQSAGMNWIGGISLSHIEGLMELGRLLGRGELKDVQETPSLLATKEGTIYLVLETLLGRGELEGLEHERMNHGLLVRLLDLCQRKREAPKSVNEFLSQYLMLWDGEENKKLIYSIIPWLQIESFEDFYKQILNSLVNLHITSTNDGRVDIIYCLTNLIANKLPVIPAEITDRLILLTSKLIKIALVSCNSNSTTVLYASIRFYYCVSILEERYSPPTWTVAPHYVVFGCIMSRSHFLISEACSLVVRYVEVMIPHYASLNLVENFSLEIEVVTTYLRDIYLILWEGQANSTELFTTQEIDEDLNSDFTVSLHCGIVPLVSFLCSNMKVDHRRLTEESLMELFKNFAEGIYKLKTFVELNK